MSDKVFYLLLYVNAMLIARPNITIIQEVKELLKFEFDMKKLGVTKNVLGISIPRNIINLEMKLS